MNQIVKFEDERGELVSFTAEDVRRLICENATPKEVSLFMAKCQAMHMNPLIGEAYLVKYGQGAASMIVGKEVFTKRAASRSDYRGNHAGVTFLTKNGAVEKREGSAVYKAAGETLLGGWCAVYVEGKEPVYNEVALEEYSTGRSMWASKPATMIRKVALVQSLREAFPDSFQGLYSEEEMGTKGEQISVIEAGRAQQAIAPEPEPAAVEVVEVVAEEAETESKAMSDDKAQELAKLIIRFSELRGKSKDDVYGAVLESKTLKATGASRHAPLDARQAELAIALLTSWVEKAELAAAEAAAAEVAE